MARSDGHSQVLVPPPPARIRHVSAVPRVFPAEVAWVRFHPPQGICTKVAGGGFLYGRLRPFCCSPRVPLAAFATHPHRWRRLPRPGPLSSPFFVTHPLVAVPTTSPAAKTAQNSSGDWFSRPWLRFMPNSVARAIRGKVTAASTLSLCWAGRLPFLPPSRPGLLHSARCGNPRPSWRRKATVPGSWKSRILHLAWQS